MPKQIKIHKLDRKKLLDNSLSSIRLGIEDYNLATGEANDPARALSSLRNLYSGILLLFKYRISLSGATPEDAAALIYKTSKALPIIGDTGDVFWQPQYQDATIEIDEIKVRFKQLTIDFDFSLIDKIRRTRNEIEHLHPSSSLGELRTFVAELFPILRDFIEQHLNKSPSELLEGTWLTMLEINNFYLDTRHSSLKKWRGCGVPEKLLPLINQVTCGVCASSLLTPTPEIVALGLKVSEAPDEFRYTCHECSYTALIAPAILEELDNEYFINPFNGDEPRVVTCIDCGLEAYVPEEDLCYWCEYNKRYDECAVCHTYLSIDEQEFNGLCSYHANRAFKDD